ncbi:hypothetical protein [Halococcoides cellulosivorans]|uniref:hypothetical protein n=1 Tax=Halococcoides cellulosivorans TaxID=1679096 RepID=UPI00131F3F52|nr:hypothetical protein [Halococcoides cellulosivorans]
MVDYTHRFAAYLLEADTDVDALSRMVKGLFRSGFTALPKTPSTDASEGLPDTIKCGPRPNESTLLDISRACRETAASGGFLTVYLDGLEVPIEIRPDDDGRLAHIPISVWGPKNAFPVLIWDDNDRVELIDVQPEAATWRADTLIDGIVALSEATTPWGVIGTTAEGGVSTPDGPPSTAELSRLPWVSVFGEEWYRHLGGRDRLLETPAWETRELSTGAVLIRRTELPPTGVGERRDFCLDGDFVDPAAYVFDGRPMPNLYEQRERILANYEREHLDPFRSLDDGEIGSDLVICPDHSPFGAEDLEPLDYTKLTGQSFWTQQACQVLHVERDGHRLYVPETGEFIRRLVDEDGTPLGTRPNGVTWNDEFLTLTILSEDHQENPIEFYRMDDIDDPSLCQQFHGLPNWSQNGSLWQDRDEPLTGSS